MIKFEEWFEKFKEENKRMCAPTYEAMKIIYASIVSSVAPKWQPIETAPDGEMKVRVGWYSNGWWTERVDVKLDGVWLGHDDEYNHYHTTSEEAPPYKYWMEYTHPPKE